MNNILEYKTELKELLNVSEEELDIMFKSTLYSFKKQMEDIGGGDFIASLMKLDYADMVVYEKGVDFVDTIKNANNISDINVKDTGDKNFMCLCGKQHLQNLHLFNHQDCPDKLVIGSTCIQQVEKLKLAYKDHTELCEKLDSIITSLKTSERVRTHNPCYKCEDLVIKKGYDYVKPHMKNYCKECLCGKDKDFIHCNICLTKVIPASVPVSKWAKGKFKEICGKCWYDKNKHHSWMRNRSN